MIGMTYEAAVESYTQNGGSADEIFGTIMDRFHAYSQGKDFVMVSGERVTARGARGAPGSATFYTQVDVASHATAHTLGDGLPCCRPYPRR